MNTFISPEYKQTDRVNTTSYHTFQTHVQTYLTATDAVKNTVLESLFNVRSKDSLRG